MWSAAAVISWWRARRERAAEGLQGDFDVPRLAIGERRYVWSLDRRRGQFDIVKPRAAGSNEVERRSHRIDVNDAVIRNLTTTTTASQRSSKDVFLSPPELTVAHFLRHAHRGLAVTHRHLSPSRSAIRRES
jgi:hypothetical protein